MTDLDLTRYEGHTPGEWHVQECGHDTTYQADAYINGPEGCIAGVWGTRKASGQGPNARLLADAPLLLAEVRRLGMELQRTSNDYIELRQSHARLLAAVKVNANRPAWPSGLCWCPRDAPQAGHVVRCAELRAAVAEAEALS